MRSFELASVVESPRMAHLSEILREAVEAAEPGHGLKVGDILVSSWGYDQTNIDFYQVQKVTPKGVVIQAIQKEVVGDQGKPSEKVMPLKDRWDTRDKPMTKRPGPGGRVKISSYENAYPWGGQPEFQTGAAYGH